MKKLTLRAVFCLALALVLVAALPVAAFAAGFGFTQNLPTTYSCISGQTYTLSVAASYGDLTGGQDITYTWYVGSAASTGSTYTFTASSDFTIKCVASGYANGVSYQADSNVCAVTVSGGSTAVVTPTPGTTTALSAPTITGQPGSVKLSAGQTATLSVSAAAPNLGNGVSLYYQWFKSASSNGANATEISGANTASYTPPAALSGTTYYFVGIKAYNGSQYSSAVYSNVVSISYDGASAPVNNGGVMKITKNPTGETVDKGGSATFIARADNAYSRVWRIVSKDTTKTVTAKEAPAYFSGLSVSGADTDTLVLSNIPASMHEWSVECKFIAADGKSYLCTTGAIIRVNGASASATATPTATAKPTATYNPTATAKPSASPSASAAPNTGDTSTAVSLAVPTISTQPVGAVLSEGETTTLTVSAAPASENGGSQLNYQWYRNDTNSNANGTKISGAQSATYVPDTISGSKYYYVGVWSSDGTTNSKVIYSSPVAVTYTASLTSPSPSVDKDEDKDDSASGLALGIIGPVIAMVLAAAAIGVGMFFLLKNVSGKKSDNTKGKYYDDYDDDYRN